MGNTSGVDLHETEVPKIDELLSHDQYLKPYEKEIRRRYGCFKQQLALIDKTENGILEFSKSYAKYGFHVDAENNINFLEWAPNAKNIYLRGDFSN
jgi:1,4-alpha-glucan branching enzyme